MPPFALKASTETTRTGPATENGFRNQACTKPEVRKDRSDRNKHAKISLFRYNQLSAEAIRVIIDGTVVPNTLQWDREVHELKHFAIEIQGKAVGTGLSGGRKWWVEFVGATVSEMDFFAYLENLVREVQRGRFSPAQETPRDKSRREAKRLDMQTRLELKCGAYKALLEKAIEEHEAYLKANKTIPVLQRNSSVEQDSEAMIVTHKERLDRIQTLSRKGVSQCGRETGL
ncbi:MAG: hypothetical protein HETSPECPRED_008117 [Heterodermia speciosa]|uniref:Uncharacterized protein n=1 Tax=Heterodermia speciosa TaxID=116794 RepID=A0A8H3I864_9LECA|nr:MAG: hypothetical protein HETSPECPRED_008117 [Heterodermia speciosa]